MHSHSMSLDYALKTLVSSEQNRNRIGTATRNHIFNMEIKVPGTGLEPAQMNPPDPKSGASTNSATPATQGNWRIFLEAASADIWLLFLVLGSWFLVLGSWFLVLGSWFLVLGSWFLVLGSKKYSAKHQPRTKN